MQHARVGRTEGPGTQQHRGTAMPTLKSWLQTCGYANKITHSFVKARGSLCCHMVLNIILGCRVQDLITGNLTSCIASPEPVFPIYMREMTRIIVVTMHRHHEECLAGITHGIEKATTVYNRQRHSVHKNAHWNCPVGLL